MNTSCMSIAPTPRSTTSDDEQKLLPTASPPPVPARVSWLWVHFALALAAFLIADHALASMVMRVGHVAFPSSLIGMFLILIVLLGCETLGFSELSTAIRAAASPAIRFITRWLPLFYVPPLVVLPIAVEGYDASELARCALIVVVGSARRRLRIRIPELTRYR